MSSYSRWPNIAFNPDALGATGTSNIGFCRRNATARSLVRHSVRVYRGEVRACGYRRPRDRGVGVLTGCLSDLLGLQALCCGG